jgi:sulfur-oxidizing protein SoxX
MFILCAGASLAINPTGALASTADSSSIEEGKNLTFNRKKGNCLACHAIEGGSLAGNVGPVLMMMKARYPERADLRAKIWDASQTNPHTVMPLFGKNRILSEDEIDHVVNYLYSL